MLDYSRSSNSKGARDSFHASLVTVKEELGNVEQQYEDLWNHLEEIRKSRAAIIERMIALLKENNIKLEKPLSRCNNSETIANLAQVADALPYDIREEVKVAMVRIDERHKQIVKLGTKLDELAGKLSHFYVPEKDYEDEVVISLQDYQQEESVEYSEEPLEEMEEDFIKEMEKAKFEEPIIEDDEMEDYFMEDEVEEEEESVVSYTMGDTQTLQEVVQHVYGDHISWYDIYLYGNNKDVLDELCEKYGYDIEDTASTVGLLAGLTFEFPNHIVSNNQVKK